MKDTYADTEHWATVNTIRAKAAIITSWNINSKFRGQGHAAKLFDEMLADADKKNTILFLSIDPDGTGLNFGELLKFYQSRGFEQLVVSSTMIRFPNMHGR